MANTLREWVESCDLAKIVIQAANRNGIAKPEDAISFVTGSLGRNLESEERGLVVRVFLAISEFGDDRRSRLECERAMLQG